MSAKEISLYDMSSVPPFSVIQIPALVTELPAGLEYVTVGLSSSVKFGAEVMFTCLGIASRVALPLPDFDSI